MGKNIPQRSRRLVQERARGRCERCGGRGSQWHHRRGKSVVDEHRHCPCNGVWLCATCHAWAHANPERAREDGFIVPRYVTFPGSHGFANYQGRWVQTACDGTLSSPTRQEA